LATSLEKKLDIEKKSIVICIPAYNEEKTIAKIIISIKNKCVLIIITKLCT